MKKFYYDKIETPISSMSDFYSRIPDLFELFKENEIHSINMLMNKEDNILLEETILETHQRYYIKKDGKAGHMFKSKKSLNRATEGSVRLNWANYSARDDIDVPKGELWILDEHDEKYRQVKSVM